MSFLFCEIMRFLKAYFFSSKHLVFEIVWLIFVSEPFGSLKEENQGVFGTFRIVLQTLTFTLGHFVSASLTKFLLYQTVDSGIISKLSPLPKCQKHPLSSLFFPLPEVN